VSTPTADVQFTIAAQSAAAQMTMLSNHIKRSLKEMREEAKKVNKPDNNQGPTNNMFAGWFSDITKAGVALWAMHQPIKVLQNAVELVRLEFQSILDRAEAARGRQVPFQAELLGMVKSIPSTEDQVSVSKELERILKDSNFGDKAQLTRMAKGAASAVSGMPYLERVKVAVQIAEDNPELAMRDPTALDALGQQAVLGMHTFGGRGATAESQQQMFFKGLTSARVSDPRLYAENVMGQVPKLNTDFGLNQIQGLALMNALTTGAQDPTGELAPTAAYSILTGIMKARQRFGAGIPQDFDKALEFIQSENPKAKEIRDFILGAFSEEFQMTDEERAMLSDAQMNKKLAANLPGSRMKTIYSAMGLFQAKGTAEDEMGMKNLLKTAYDEIGIVRRPDGTIDEAATYQKQTDDWKTQQSRLADNPMFKDFQLDRNLKTTTENVRINKESTAMAELFSQADELLRDSGVSATQRLIYRTGDYFFNSTDEASVNDRLRWRMEQAARNKAFHGVRKFRTPGGGEYLTKGVNESNIGDIFADSQIDSTEARKYGFTQEESKVINALFELMKKLEDSKNQPQKVEVINQPEVKVANQPPAQPRQPAAAQLNGGGQ